MPNRTGNRTQKTQTKSKVQKTRKDHQFPSPGKGTNSGITIIGGRRVVRSAVLKSKNNFVDEKELQNTLKKMNMTEINAVDNVLMMQESDQTMLEISKPKVQMAMHSNMFVISGVGKEKTFREMVQSMMTNEKSAKYDSIDFEDFMNKDASKSFEDKCQDEAIVEEEKKEMDSDDEEDEMEIQMEKNKNVVEEITEVDDDDEEAPIATVIQ
ncbi:hypothetical protein SNEBB_006017 [Seison nebaliae]|nr:hypothetical protein SNEBB_006017 [Seison nebaliae]